MFWRLTYRETQAVIDGAAKRLVREQDARAWLAWHIEALHRTKKLPELKSLMHGAKPEPRRRQTVEEQMAIAQMWHASVTRH